MYQEPFEHTRESYKGLTIRIVADDEARDVREEFDHFGTMICFHFRYNLGDKHGFSSPDEFLLSLVDGDAFERFKEWNWPRCEAGHNSLEQALAAADEAEREWLRRRIEESVLMLPLYLYDHSGLTMNTGGFSCPWDSGQVGWIYATHADIRKEYGKKRLSKKTLERATDLLRAEVQEYDDYLTGNVWGFIVENENGDDLDSCWGFIGDPEYCLTEAKHSADGHAEHIAKQKAAETAAMNEAFARALEAERPDMYGSA